ncbi:MAG: HRDC domain-containing protein, partial [Methylococcales bacterium]|nr:HRDC domain-containing protein [Methylococcales bacterium]
PPETWDASVAAQKALSSVYRTGQRFGVAYVVDVLTGKQDDRIQRNAHDQLSTFGIGSDISAAEWRSIYRQLIAHGYLDTDLEYGALKLNEKCRPLLRGEASIQLRRQRKAKRNAAKTTSTGKTQLRSFDQPLFEALRACRMELAQAQGVPPYVIFHDSTLLEMAKKRPATETALQYLSGVGEKKLERYGKQFLAVIREHPLTGLLNNQLTDTINETLLLHSQGKNVELIARERDLKSSTIHQHFSAAIEAKLISCREVLSLEEDEYTRINSAIEHFYSAEEKRLKPVFDALDEVYDYGILRCVLVEFQ